MVQASITAPTSRSSADRSTVLLDDHATDPDRRRAAEQVVDGLADERGVVAPDQVDGRGGVGHRGAERAALTRRLPGRDLDVARLRSRRPACRRPGGGPATSWTRTMRHPSDDPEGGRGQRRVAALVRCRGPRRPEERLVRRREQQRVAECPASSPEARRRVERLGRGLAEVEPGVEDDPLGPRNACGEGPRGPFDEEAGDRRHHVVVVRARDRGSGARAGCGWPPPSRRRSAAAGQVVGVGEPADVVADHGTRRVGRPGHRRPPGVDRERDVDTASAGPRWPG